MKQKKKKKGTGKVQGFAMLYGRSSKAIRIPNGEQVGSMGSAGSPRAMSHPDMLHCKTITLTCGKLTWTALIAGAVM